jgi:hypothetical protein
VGAGVPEVGALSIHARGDMSEKRICPCGEEYWWPKQYWLHESHKEVVANAASNTPDVANEATNSVANESNKTYKYRDPEKRRAYQREYMRKVRKK